jgi:small subunit ribosomal protein S20
MEYISLDSNGQILSDNFKLNILENSGNYLIHRDILRHQISQKQGTVSTVANHKDAMKRHRQNQKRKTYNKHYKSSMRSLTKKFRAAADDNDTATLKEMLPVATKLIQKLSQKGIIHKNQADRRISRMYKLLNRTLQNS